MRRYEFQREHFLSSTVNDVMKDHFFTYFANKMSCVMGSPWAFVVALTVVLVWALSGPVFDYSDTWQLVINTGTTIITFLMVFLIQNTQNRDTHAMQLKLDELIRAIEEAHNSLLDIEELSEGELEKIRENFKKLASAARKNAKDPNKPYE